MQLEIRPFTALNETEQQALFDFVSRAGATAPNLEAMRHSMTGVWYDGGRNLLTLWTAPDRPVGTIGVITKDAQARAEVFLTYLCVDPTRAADALPQLLQAAYGLARPAAGVAPDVVVRLGVSPMQEYLIPDLEREGFRFAYSILEMVLAGQPGLKPGARQGLSPLPPGPTAGAVRFEPVTLATVDDYVAIHNAAFLGSPNGALTDSAAVAEELAAADFLDQYQLGYMDGLPAVTLAFTVKGSVGNLDLLAVAPGFQGRGLGRAGLGRALEALAARGVSEVRLQVVEINTPAVTLYMDRGFVVERTQSRWFSGPPLP